MKRFFNTFLLFLLFSSALPLSIHAQATIKDLESVFSRFISVAIGLVALVCIIMFAIGGLKYLTAGADKEGAASATRTITYGLIGLIVTISAWIILSLLGTFLGLNFSSFSICLPGYTGPGCT